MRKLVLFLLFLLFFILSKEPVRAWEKHEHQLLADSIYVSLLLDCGIELDENTQNINIDDNSISFPRYLGDKITFGTLCAEFAEDDIAFNRFHKYFKTIPEQLRSVKAGDLDSAIETINNFEFSYVSGEIKTPFISSDNVVASYHLYHIAALHLAKTAGQSENDSEHILKKALSTEAVAQGYLADAFSSAHLLVPITDWAAPLHTRNTKETHNYYRNEGVYVINSKGDTWVTFGDKLLYWFTPTFKPVFNASRNSLSELLLVFYHTKGIEIPQKLISLVNPVSETHDVASAVSSWLTLSDGEFYYNNKILPTLMEIPMPIAATWSFRTQIKDEHNIRQRYHYPQLLEKGYHDPNIHKNGKKFLYSKNSFPIWMIPEVLRGDSAIYPDSLIKNNPDWASVYWVQNRAVSPSFTGFLSGIGFQLINLDGIDKTSAVINIGYGLWNDLILIKNVAININLYPSLYDDDRFVITPITGFDLPIKFTDWLGFPRLEGGMAVNIQPEKNIIRSMFSVSIKSRVFPLKVTNIGFTLSLKYQAFYLDRTLKGPAFEIIFQ